jgi:hypothetical protein
MDRRSNIIKIKESAPLERRIIRVWREETQPPLSERFFITSEPQLRSSLRKERALSGCYGYDLNRHIRLLRQRNRTEIKVKTPSR